MPLDPDCCAEDQRRSGYGMIVNAIKRNTKGKRDDKHYTWDDLEV